ncbi:protein GUCD1 [Atheta coriaria]|uniref:protein GUCD1 n=1 Tax=Dalotia coriaria TaxID=877792 RepID=UPI0031F3A67F
MRREFAYRGVIANKENRRDTRASPPPPSLPMLRRTVWHEVRHHRQRYAWDCGLACVQMVLPEQHARQLETNFHSICQDEGIAKSTWTIDLCYILRRFALPHAFYTLTLGAHTGYKQAAFYSSIFASDEDRVNRRFAEAEALGLRVRRSSLTLAGVLARLRRGPAIALIDSSRVACPVCKRNRLSVELRKCLPIPLPAPAYLGHFIVLCGYDLRSRAIYYRNPARHDHYCVMSLETFEESRRAFGTDEDIIFIENSKVTS